MKTIPKLLSGTPRPQQSGLAVPQKPDGNVIEFKVVDGLAIAYGDIILGKPEAGTTEGVRGHYEAATPQTWDRPEIPFLISPELPNPKRVEQALDYLRQHTPVNFVPYQGQRDAIVFEPGTHQCYSQLGRVGGLQSIKLEPGCRWIEIMHEIMHALGFIHEQSRPDRDQYLEVLWPNIDEQYKSQFAVVPETFVDTIKGSPFDYHSIMLYSPTTFAASPGLLTMRSTGTEPIAPMTEGLSELDIQRLNRLYGFH